MFVGHQEHFVEIDFVSNVNPFQLLRNKHISLCANAIRKFREQNSRVRAFSILPVNMSSIIKMLPWKFAYVLRHVWPKRRRVYPELHRPPQLCIVYQIIVLRQTICRDRCRSRACVSQIPWSRMIFNLKKRCTGAQHIIKTIKAHWVCCCGGAVSCLRIQKISTHQSPMSRCVSWTNDVNTPGWKVLTWIIINEKALILPNCWDIGEIWSALMFSNAIVKIFWASFRDFGTETYRTRMPVSPTRACLVVTNKHRAENKFITFLSTCYWLIYHNSGTA